MPALMVPLVGGCGDRPVPSRVDPAGGGFGGDGACTVHVLLWNQCSRGWRNLRSTHQLQGPGQGLKGCNRYKGRSAVQSRTIAGIAHPGRQGPEKTGPVLDQNRACPLPTAAIAGAQHSTKKRMPRILDPQFSFFVCGMIADFLGDHGTRTLPHRSASGADDPAQGLPTPRCPSSCPSRRRQDRREHQCPARSCRLHRPDHLRQRGHLQRGIKAQAAPIRQL